MVYGVGLVVIFRRVQEFLALLYQALTRELYGVVKGSQKVT